MIQNTGKICSRVALKPFDEENFTVTLRNNTPEKKIHQLAPGMSVWLDVEARYKNGDQPCEAAAKVVIIEDSSVLEVPLKASPPEPVVSVDGDADFGRIVGDGRMHKRSIKLRNGGRRPTTWRIVRVEDPGNASAELPLELLPSSGMLTAVGEEGSEAEVVCSISQAYAGKSEVKFIVEVEGQKAPVVFYVKAKMVGHAVKLVRNTDTVSAKPLSDLDLGCVYYQTGRTTTATLVNDGPTPVTFSIASIGHDRWVEIPGGARIPEFSADTDGDLSGLAITLEPSGGVIGPREKLTVQFHFNPIAAPPDSGWQKDYEAPPRRDYKFFMRACAVGTDMISDFELTGSACAPAFVLSTTKLTFPSLTVGEEATETFSLKNEAPQLPLSFEADSIAHYTCKPSNALVMPGETVDFTVRFKPNQASPLELPLPLHFAQRTMTVPLQLNGSCSADTASLTRSRVHRLSAIKSQLQSKTAFRFGFTPVTSMKAQYISGPDGRQRHGIHATTNPNAKLRSVRPTAKPYLSHDPAMTLDLAATSRKSGEMKKYDNFVKDLGTKRRERVVTRRRNNPKKVGYNGGIGPAPEATPPKPKKRDAEAERRAKILGYSAAAAAEVATQQVLPPTDLSRIGPRLHRIDFGDVCEGSTNVIQLELKNGIDNPVSMQLMPHAPELGSTEQQLFVIPARSVEVVDVVLSGLDGKTARHYNTNIDYVINGHHKATIVTTARIVPPNLELSTDAIDVQVKSAAKCESFVSSFTLQNTLGHAAHFNWILSDPNDGGLTAEHYSIAPAEGRVDEHGTLDCVVQLHPSVHMPKKATFVLNVAGTTAKKTLTVKAKSATPKVRMEGSLLLFGKIAINAPSVLEATVVNYGSVDAFYKIGDMMYRPLAQYGLDIRPMEGTIRAGEKVNLQVSFVPTQLCKFEADFKVNVRGGAPVKVHVSGTGTNPELGVDVDSFFFGRVPCAAVSKKPFMLTNTGRSRLSVTFDLREQRDFAIALPEDKVYGIPRRIAAHFDEDLLFADEPEDPEVVQQAWQKALMADFLSQTKLPAAQKSAFAEEVKAAGSMLSTLRATAGRDSTIVTRKGHAFRVDVEPGTSLPVMLEFSPTEVAAYDFKLPIAVNGLPFGSKRVRATAARPNLVLSETAFDYGCLYLSGADDDEFPDGGDGGDEGIGPADEMISKKVKLQWIGPQAETLLLGLSTSSSALGGFYANVSGTEIFVADNLAAEIPFQPMEEKELVITFHPPASEFFESRFQFRTSGPNGIDAGEIYVRGFATRPFLAADKLFVECPVVPVGVESVTTFTISAHGLKPGAGYSLDCKLPEATESCPLTVTYPKGTTMKGGSVESLPVQVAFVAETPMSFDAALEFTDPAGGTCEVRVTGKADVSMLTIYPYVAVNRDAYFVGTAPEQSAEDYLESMSKLASRWMSTFGLTKQTPIDMPESLTNDCARRTFDMIKHLGGTDIPGLALVRPDVMTPGEMLHSFGLMIKYLTEQGAVLSDVRPMMLLPKPFFTNWKREQARNMLEAGLLHLNQGKQWKAYYDAMEADFNRRTCHAWTTILTQVLRVFTLGHVTERKVMARCNGTLPAIDDTVLQVHCDEEKLLLQWLTYLHQSVSGAEHSVSNFGDDLADGRVLASVLVAHVPPLADTFFSDLFVVAETESQRRHNACRVVAAVKAIGLDEFVLDWKDITSPNPVWMTLLAAFLFESLAQYTLPEDTIVFSGLLHQKVTRNIKIANPTNQTLTYRVRIDGTDQFSSKATITVPKRSEKALEVVCVPRFYEPAEAVLLLTGSPTGAARGSVMIFRLETRVKKSQAAAVAEFKQPCYALRKLQVPVTNTFSEAGTFTLSTLVTTADEASDFASTVVGGTAKQKRKATLKRVNTDRPGYRDNKRDFLWADDQEVTLKPGETKRITCNVCPTRLGHHRVSLLLTHPRLGQLESIAAGVASQPKAISTLNWSCNVGEEQGRTMTIPYVNKAKFAAIQAIPGAMDEPSLTKTLTLASSSGKLLSEEVELNVALVSDIVETALRVPLEVPKKVTLSPGEPHKDGTRWRRTCPPRRWSSTRRRRTWASGSTRCAKATTSAACCCRATTTCASTGS